MLSILKQVKSYGRRESIPRHKDFLLAILWMASNTLLFLQQRAVPAGPLCFREIFRQKSNDHGMAILSIYLRYLTRMKTSKFLKIILFLLSFFSTGYLLAQSAHPLHAGLYEDEQASRGRDIYMTACVSCHASDLRGNSNSPGLIGMSFLFLWENRPLSELFEKMRKEMPTNAPGSLSTTSYLDLLAFILQRNGYPESELLTEDRLFDPGLLIVPPP